jgi:hypothetical protein
MGKGGGWTIFTVRRYWYSSCRRGVPVVRVRDKKHFLNPRNPNCTHSLSLSTALSRGSLDLVEGRIRAYRNRDVLQHWSARPSGDFPFRARRFGRAIPGLRRLTGVAGETPLLRGFKKGEFEPSPVCPQRHGTGVPRSYVHVQTRLFPTHTRTLARRHTRNASVESLPSSLHSL